MKLTANITLGRAYQKPDSRKRKGINNNPNPATN